VTVSTVDQRSDGLKCPELSNYIGTTRDGYGIPFRVYTSSGSPLSDDLSAAIVSSLNGSGYQATSITVIPVTDAIAAKSRLIASSSDRKILVTINKWESSTLINTELATDINVQVYDHLGKLLADESFSESKGLGGNIFVPELHARKNVLSEASKILTQVFSSPKIHNSL
jgi:hypothetical protein